MSAPTETLVTLQIDGRTLQAPAGAYVLQVAQQAGMTIPTLCDHPAVEPVGACRLCMVEVTHSDWKGWSGLMTACLYPVSPGIIVQTQSPRVQDARRRVLSLLAARCPHSPTIQQLAARYGATAQGLWTDAAADNCILCGLCTRICEAYGPAAITTCDRGTTKRVGSFGQEPPAECVGCGACASICPTGHLQGQRTATGYQIWSRTFDTAVCHVTEERCLGCGACEEACPFAVARVVRRAGAIQVAIIPSEHCRGCGACVGACPSGAIEQPGYSWRELLTELPARKGGQS
jgi:bidirectional [NiFe] hydrogenase diaphorase subunit